MNYNGKYVEIKAWARKDHDRPFGARNMYRVCRETEKAVLINPVDTWDVDFTFWCPKSAITHIYE
jgi:hypothetical protein